MVILHDEEYYRSRVPQPDLGLVKNFLRFIWNKERKTFLDRTAKEWGRLGIFYLAFFSVLGSIFAIQMKISVDYVSKLDKPFFQYAGILPRSSMGKRFAIFRSPWQFDSPGIVFKPNSISTTSPIIAINSARANTKPKRYIQALTDFLQGTVLLSALSFIATEPNLLTSKVDDGLGLLSGGLVTFECKINDGTSFTYYNKNISNYDLNCQDKGDVPNHYKKPCFFDVRNLGTCSKPPYGYTEPVQPCVLIKFNKRFDWVPECYNRSSHLPKNMPDDLKKLVQGSDKLYVWLSCDGVNNVDKEHVGEIEYIPRPGFPAEYFPFGGQSNYISPIVALRFKNLTRER